jgi:Fe-S-cluster-containing hydrogenase component 2
MEAIRVRRGKAQITESWCIDCGECIRGCNQNAKFVLSNNLADLAAYKHNIALPAPSLYAQFDLKIRIEKILAGLICLGFDDVFEVAAGAEIVSLLTRDHLANTKDAPRPVISTACPAVFRLIQMKFPELIENLSPVGTPVETAARIARAQAAAKLGLDPAEIGTWFLTPCPAKVTSIFAPQALTSSNVSGAIAINKIYGQLRKTILELPPGQSKETQASWQGFGWCIGGGESIAVGLENTLVVNGIHNAIDALEQISLGKLKKLDHVEVLACPGGCTGGALLPENRHVASYRLQQRILAKQKETCADIMRQNIPPEAFLPDEKRTSIKAKPILPLDQDRYKALQKLEAVASTVRDLPGLDCGACGSPSCKSLAEDIVQGQAFATDCIFILRKKVGQLAQDMINLSSKVPPPLDIEENNT